MKLTGQRNNAKVPAKTSGRFTGKRSQWLTNTGPPSKEELENVETLFDFSKFPVDIANFAKHYILSGGNATEAIRMSGSYQGCSEGGKRAYASKLLRKLRSHPDFWDMLGLGYGDLREVADTLKLTDPKAAAAIIMKVNKEDVELIQSDSTVRILFEKDLDD